MIRAPVLNKQLWKSANKLNHEFMISTGGTGRMVKYYDHFYDKCDWWMDMKYRHFNKSENQKTLDLHLFEAVGNGWKYPGCEYSKPVLGKIEGLVKLGATIDHHAPFITPTGMIDLNAVIMERVLIDYY